MKIKRFLPNLLFGFLLVLCPTFLVGQDRTNVAAKIDELERQAEKYIQEQKPQLAIPVFRQIVSLDPANLSVHGNLGVLLFFQNDYPEAIPELRAALQLEPKPWKIQALLGIAEKRTGDTAAARNDLEESFVNIDDAKIKREAGLELIELASAAGEMDQAAEVISKLEEAAPQDPQLIFVAYQISTQMVERSLLNMAIAAPDSAELHMMMADQFVLIGDPDNAIAQYREAIHLNPNLPGVHFELGVQLKSSSDPALKPLAESEFKAAIALNQFDEKAWRALGEVMADKENFSAAKEDFTKALALNPKDSQTETDLARLLITHGDIRSATSLLESAVKDDPTDAVAHYQLSTLYRQAGRTTDSQHEMDEFAHYKNVRDKLGNVFRQFRHSDSLNDTTDHSSKQ